MATVLYARVSTTDQTLEHQRTQGSTSSDLGTVLSGGFSRFVDIEKTHRLDRGGLTVSRDLFRCRSGRIPLGDPPSPFF